MADFCRQRLNKLMKAPAVNDDAIAWEQYLLNQLEDEIHTLEIQAGLRK